MEKSWIQVKIYMNTLQLLYLILRLITEQILKMLSGSSSKFHFRSSKDYNIILNPSFGCLFSEIGKFSTLSANRCLYREIGSLFPNSWNRQSLAITQNLQLHDFGTTYTCYAVRTEKYFGSSKCHANQMKHSKSNIHKQHINQQHSLPITTIFFSLL